MKAAEDTVHDKKPFSQPTADLRESRLIPMTSHHLLSSFGIWVTKLALLKITLTKTNKTKQEKITLNHTHYTYNFFEILKCIKFLPDFFFFSLIFTFSHAWPFDPYLGPLSKDDFKQETRGRVVCLKYLWKEVFPWVKCYKDGWEVWQVSSESWSVYESQYRKQAGLHFSAGPHTYTPAPVIKQSKV